MNSRAVLRALSSALSALSALLLGATVAAAAPVEFLVTAPGGETPAVRISGSPAALGAWRPDGPPLARGEDGRWRLAVDLPEGVHEFKFTRGGWDAVELTADGGEAPNRRIAVGPAGGRVECAVPRFRAAGAGAPASTRTGDIREHSLRSRLLDREVRFLVHLPHGYGRAAEPCPLLFLLDGNNMFDAATAFGGVEWGMDEALESLARAGKIRPPVAVAVYNDADRMNHYTFCPDPKHGGGKADLYLRALLTEVRPFVAKRYRVRTDRAGTAILGSSLGGLLSLYAAWRWAGSFGTAGVVSPSVWWADRAILKVIAHPAPHRPRLWVDMGTNEGNATVTDGTPVSLDNARRLRDRLRGHGYASPADFHYEEFPGATHSEGAWAARTPRMLLYLYGD